MSKVDAKPTEETITAKPIEIQETKVEVVKEVEVVQTPKQSIEFTQENTIKIWNEYKLQISDDVQICAIVNEINPVKKGDEIWFELQAQTQKNCFEKEIKMQILQQFKQAFQVEDISIHVTYKEESYEVKPTTSADKFDYLLKQNPYLQDLKDTFNLELE